MIKIASKEHLHCVALGKICITMKWHDTDIVLVYHILSRDHIFEAAVI